MTTTGLNVVELIELAELLQASTPETTEEMADVCAEIHRALDLQDQIAAAEEKVCVALKKQLAELRAPFTEQLGVVAEVMKAAKGALVRRIEADEAAAMAAIANKGEVPAPRALPKGLSVRRATVLAAVDIEKLGEEYFVLVPDADKILQASEAGLVFEGATCEVQTSVVYKRPKKA